MVTRLLRGGHAVVAFNRSEAPRHAAVAEGAEEAKTLDDEKRCWTSSMVPAVSYALWGLTSRLTYPSTPSVCR
ncbi:MAG TPA: hypothetical protein VHV83_02685 [Armatimonadota bacterium]|nr:hypothetical protein [Armatimonadota bacterium]